MYFLDSDICIELLRGELPYAYAVMRQSDPRLFGVPAIVEAELRTGARKSDHPQKNMLLVERFLAPFARIPFDSDCAREYAKVRARLERTGQSVGPNGLLIASTALARGATLVTRNVREFSRVDGLEIEDWAEVDL